MATTLRRRRAGGDKRIVVLTKVVEVLAERGFENVRFRDVADSSGVAISTLQHYFGAREDMVIEAVELATDHEVAELEAVADAEPDAWQRLVRMVDRSLGSSEPTRRMLVEFWRAAMRDDHLRAYSAEVQTRYRAPFLAAVRDIGPSGDAEQITDLVIVALAGAIVCQAQGLPAPSPAGFREILLAQLKVMLG